MRISVFFTLFVSGFIGTTTAISADVWYVSEGGSGDGSSWGQALGSVGDAITAASSGDAIWVSGGTYSETVELKEGISLYGGFASGQSTLGNRDFVANETIIDATGLESSVLTATGIEGTVVDGFSLTGGYTKTGGGVYCSESSLTLLNCTISGNTVNGDDFQLYGGGVYCMNSSSTFTNCTVSGNGSYYRGGGVYCAGSSVSTFTNCTISENSGFYGGGGVYCKDTSSTEFIDCSITENTTARMGGGVFSEYSPPSEDSPTLVFTDCTISGNIARGETANGAGVYCWKGALTFTNCTFSDNIVTNNYINMIEGGGGGVFCFESSPTFTNCTVSNNTATGRAYADDGGGVYCYNSSPTFTNCTISGNTAEGNSPKGGGVYCYNYSSPSFTNCTVSGNSAGNDGGVVYCEWYSSPTFTNCILWNEGSAEHLNANVTYSCTSIPRQGEGNIVDDPLFVDPNAGDYSLSSGSPCIDAGNPDSQYNDGCRPPGQGTDRGDMGATGGPGNCASLQPPAPTFTLVVNSGSGDGDYAAGTVQTIIADAAPAGQRFDQWTGDTSFVANMYDATTTVTMPASAVTVTATYKDGALHDWNGDGIVSIVGDVPPFVNCVYFQNCPSDVDTVALGDCNNDGLISIVGDVPCFVDCVYFDNCPP